MSDCGITVSNPESPSKHVLRTSLLFGAATNVRCVRPDTLARYLTDPAQQDTPSGARRSARTMNRTRTVRPSSA